MTSRRDFVRLAAGGVAGGIALSGSDAEAAKGRYVVPPMPVPSLPVVGGGQFPVHRIYCIGLNYPMHVREGEKAGAYQGAPPPTYFQKSNDMIVQNGATVRYPIDTKDYEHEIEMVLALKSGGIEISKEQALTCVYGYALGLDMTRRDRQLGASKIGFPWEQGKSFDQSAPCTAIRRATDGGHVSKGRIELMVNGKMRQQDDVGNMILDVPAIISFVSLSVELAPGDLIFTGTPAGTAAVVSGDHMVGRLDGVGELAITVG